MLRRVHSSRVIKHGEEFVPNINGNKKESNHRRKADHTDSDCETNEVPIEDNGEDYIETNDTPAPPSISCRISPRT